MVGGTARHWVRYPDGRMVRANGPDPGLGQAAAVVSAVATAGLTALQIWLMEEQKRRERIQARHERAREAERQRQAAEAAAIQSRASASGGYAPGAADSGPLSSVFGTGGGGGGVGMLVAAGVGLVMLLRRNPRRGRR